MRVFPIRRPSVGVSVGPRGVTLVEAVQPWTRLWQRHRAIGRIRRWREHELADAASGSTVQASQSAPSSLAAAFRALRGTLRGPVPIALSLWDPCGHVAVLAFDTLPSKKAEFETLVRWRLERELNLPATGGRVVYQVFRTAGRPNGKARAHVLAALIGVGLLGQYEEACLQAGLFPSTVGLTTFQLFEFCRPTIQQAIDAHGREAGDPVDECFFLHRAAWGFSFLAIRSGCPVFVRAKPWLAAPPIDEDAARDSSVPAALDQEIIATLQYYREAMPQAAQPLRPLFFVSTTDEAAVDPERLRPWGVQMHTLSRDGVGGDTLPLTALPALAAVHAA